MDVSDVKIVRRHIGLACSRNERVLCLLLPVLIRRLKALGCPSLAIFDAGGTYRSETVWPRALCFVFSPSELHRDTSYARSYLFGAFARAE